MGGIICNFGGGGGVGREDSQTSSNPDKPDGTMTLSQANKWAHIGNGEGVYIDFTKIILSKSVTVERFNDYNFQKDGNPGIYIKFDGEDFVNPNQALVYGTIGLVLVDKNTVWAMPDEYDFDIKALNSNLKNYNLKNFIRDAATIGGAWWSEMGYTRPGQSFPIYFRGYQKIPFK